MPDRPSTRNRLLQVGIRHFQTFGYHGAGLAAILEEASAPKGSLYHHYPGGKQQLAIESMRWLADEVAGFLRSLDRAGATGSAMVLAMADYGARGLEQAPAGRGSLVTVLASEVAPVVPDVRAALRDAIELWVDILAAGAAREKTHDPANWARLALAQIEGATTLARIAGVPGTVTSLVSAWLELRPVFGKEDFGEAMTPELAEQREDHCSSPSANFTSGVAS